MIIMEKTLTIVIPTYNMEKYLDKCLSSLIIDDKNLLSLVEVLIINDGSKDRSSEIAHEYEKKYSGIFRVIDKENGNYGSCVNRGLLEAKGKYIKVLDADDYFDTESFSKYIDLARTLDVDAIFNDADIVDSKGRITGHFKTHVHRNSYFKFFDYTIFPQMHMVAYRTENLRRINYNQTEGISYTDQEWVFEPITTIKRAYYCKLSLYKYLVGREGQTMDPQIQDKYLSQIFDVLISLIMTFEKYTNSNSIVYFWMKRKLIRDLEYHYKYIIIDNKDYKNNILVSFDKRLKTLNPRIFCDMNAIFIDRIFHYPYIKIWRRYRELDKNAMILKLYYITCRIHGYVTLLRIIEKVHYAHKTLF